MPTSEHVSMVANERGQLYSPPNTDDSGTSAYTSDRPSAGVILPTSAQGDATFAYMAKTYYAEWILGPADTGATAANNLYQHTIT